MTPLRLASLALALILTVAIVWATGQASILDSFGRIVADPWGLVSLIDLYVGFFVAAVLIWRFEPSRAVAIAAIVLMPFLGNVVSLLWLAWRAGRVLVTRQS